MLTKLLNQNKVLFTLVILIIALLITSCNSEEEELENRKKLIDNYSERFDLALKNGFCDSARKFADAQIEIDSLNPMGQYNKGIFYLYCNDSSYYDFAIISFNKSIELVSNENYYDSYWITVSNAKNYVEALMDSSSIGTSGRQQFIWSVK